MSRRTFLEAGSLALGGLTLPDLLARRAAPGENPGPGEADTSVILIWLQGGPSHMETYDMKPEAPGEYGGLLKPIQTKAPGMDICELLPLHARVADKFNVIRSIRTVRQPCRRAGRFLSGYNPLRPLDPKSQFPCLGPVVSKMLQGKRDRSMPNTWPVRPSLRWRQCQPGAGLPAVRDRGRSQRREFQGQQPVAGSEGQGPAG
ncbi:MAG: hypothetical protein Ct9H300mP1_30950 [Planctomycetaceae bacterium]|nr:MAG: hypothetical protein Ct9H300mP1_30950 [Planctomycetaceae bacterium]